MIFDFVEYNTYMNAILLPSIKDLKKMSPAQRREVRMQVSMYFTALGEIETESLSSIMDKAAKQAKKNGLTREIFDEIVA